MASRRMRRRRAGPPTAGTRCATVSANATAPDNEPAREEGIADDLNKPLRIDRLRELIMAHGAAWPP